MRLPKGHTCVPPTQTRSPSPFPPRLASPRLASRSRSVLAITIAFPRRRSADRPHMCILLKPDRLASRFPPRLASPRVPEASSFSDRVPEASIVLASFPAFPNRRSADRPLISRSVDRPAVLSRCPDVLPRCPDVVTIKSGRRRSSGFPSYVCVARVLPCTSCVFPRLRVVKSLNIVYHQY